MKRAIVWLIVVAALGAGVWAVANWRGQPPEVQFGRAIRETIHSSVPTNGKVEPIEWAVARAERSGPIKEILIQRGQTVAKNAPLVQLDSAEAQASLASAQARIAQAHAELDVIQRGGRATDLAEISSGLKRAHFDLDNAQKEYDALRRLEARQSATKIEVTAAHQRVEQAQLQIQALEQRRQALGATADQASAQARLEEAQAAATLAQTQIRQSIVRSPIEGTVYQFDLKPGGYLNAGDPVASIGTLDRVRVNVYVDEPDLGRVAKGMPVTITWDARPGQKWDGEVDRTPTQIQALGTRQVGEVVCIIRNPRRELLPGTNVNVEILSESVDNAIAIPKEAVRNEHGRTGVYLLAGDHIQWQPVKLGIANTTRSQVLEGVKEGDAVALYADKPLKDGMPVKPVFP